MSETPTPALATAEAAEAAFYAAFEARDLIAMEAVWSAADDTLCIHPMGRALHGWASIARSWEMIFDGIGDARFGLSDVKVLEMPGLCVRFVHENIHHGPGYSGVSRVLATNVFRLEGDGWRIVSHHASPGGIVREPDEDGGEQFVH